MCFITILLRKCEEVSGPQGSGEGSGQRGGKEAMEDSEATANMTASGKRFIIYLSAEIGTEAKQKPE